MMNFADVPVYLHREAVDFRKTINGLIETAKAHDLNPEKYLTEIYRQLPNIKTVEQVEQLLPWKIKID